MNSTLKKIYLTGPESTGKSTLGESLAAHYKCIVVPEYARMYLTENNGKYTYKDLKHISNGQMDIENTFGRVAENILLMDTGHAVLHVWSSHKYGKVDKRIEKRLMKQKGALHLLCKPDIAWEQDPLRESYGEREVLFEKYKNVLEKYELEHEVVDGDGQARVDKAIALVDQFLK